MRSPIPALGVVGIFGSNRERVVSGVDFDLGLIQPLFRIGILHCIDFHLILVPTGDVYVAVNVVEFNSAVGGQGVRLMEFLAQGAAMCGGITSEGKDEQGADRSQDSSQPGGGLAMMVHRSLRSNALDAAIRHS